MLLETHTLRLNVGCDDDKDVKMAVMMMSMQFRPDCTTKSMEKLDPVGSTVRYEMMKLFAGSV